MMVRVRFGRGPTIGVYVTLRSIAAIPLLCVCQKKMGGIIRDKEKVTKKLQIGVAQKLSKPFLIPT